MKQAREYTAKRQDCLTCKSDMKEIVKQVTSTPKFQLHFPYCPKYTKFGFYLNNSSPIFFQKSVPHYPQILLSIIPAKSDDRHAAVLTPKFSPTGEGKKPL